jgi:hypothetical protein
MRDTGACGYPGTVAIIASVKRILQLSHFLVFGTEYWCDRYVSHPVKR